MNCIAIDELIGLLWMHVWWCGETRELSEKKEEEMRLKRTLRQGGREPRVLIYAPAGMHVECSNGTTLQLLMFFLPDDSQRRQNM